MRLRPYNLLFMLMRVGSGNRVAYNGIIEALDRIKADPDLEIELVEEEDDVCRVAKDVKQASSMCVTLTVLNCCG